MSVSSNKVVITVTSAQSSGYNINVVSWSDSNGNINISGIVYYNGSAVSNVTVAGQYAALFTGNPNDFALSTTTDKNGNFLIGSFPTSSTQNTIYLWVIVDGKMEGLTSVTVHT